MEDIEVWRWIWVGAFVVLGIGEMVTAGLFMLPFAIGAGAAAILAWFEVPVWLQLVVFLITIALALAFAYSGPSALADAPSLSGSNPPTDARAG